MADLVDGFNRRIEYLRISITDRCNLRCRYCMPEQGIELIPHEGILTFEEILRVARVFARSGISKIRLTGGEPLVRRGVVDLIQRLGRVEGVEDLSLTTNGVLLEPFAERLVAAGLKRINISLDSLRPEKFFHITRRDVFHRVWAGIEESLRVGLYPVKLNVVAIRGFNEDEIADFARLTVEMPLHVRFIEYMPSGQGEPWTPEDVLTVDQIREKIETIMPLKEEHSENNNGPALTYSWNGAKGRIGFISPISRHFCQWCNRLRLTSDGKLRPCLFSDREFDLRSHLRDGCDDGKLAQLLGTALKNKPRGHTINTHYFR
ncbi:MAG: GTP 3',8-cyclase MoaA, partial [Deltaproteobacteria bacterium]|nr:GTP 3',8-cyclase MoaA [Deltaproteobacteria bacterium]